MTLAKYRKQVQLLKAVVSMCYSDPQDYFKEGLSAEQILEADRGMMKIVLGMLDNFDDEGVYHANGLKKEESFEGEMEFNI